MQLTFNHQFFTGFFEVYLSDAWYLFDATKLAPVSGYVRIGAGSDAADMCFATIIDAALSTHLEVWTKEDRAGDTAPDNSAYKAILAVCCQQAYHEHV